MFNCLLMLFGSLEMESNHYKPLYEGGALPLCYLGIALPDKGSNLNCQDQNLMYCQLYYLGMFSLFNYQVASLGLEPSTRELQPRALPVKLKSREKQKTSKALRPRG